MLNRNCAIVLIIIIPFLAFIVIMLLDARRFRASDNNIDLAHYYNDDQIVKYQYIQQELKTIDGIRKWVGTDIIKTITIDPRDERHRGLFSQIFVLWPKQLSHSNESRSILTLNFPETPTGDISFLIQDQHNGTVVLAISQKRLLLKTTDNQIIELKGHTSNSSMFMTLLLLRESKSSGQ